MKKCPNCQKEFPDTMRFCQTDGTPLVEEQAAEDPLKTTIVRHEDIAASIPPSDPFKTVVGNSESKDESGDLLQLPVEFDAMKTMIAAPIVEEKPVLEEPKPELPKFEEIKNEIKAETPSSPFGGFSQPSEPLPETPDLSNDPTILQPEPPKFNAPDLTPPSFGSSPFKDKEDDDLPATVMQNPWDSAPKSNESPFSKPSETPMSSPFDAPKPAFDQPSSFDAPKNSFNEPSSPFGQTPQSPFESPKSPFDTPNDAPYNPPPASFDAPQNSYNPPPFQEPSNQFGSSQFDQMNQGFGNQPLQQNEWTPPPSPDVNWQSKDVGANTPFQPPPAMQGQNQTLPIISLVFGILSVCCYIGPITGIVALITGYLGMKNANADPNQYGGKGLATAGMIVGGIFFVLYSLYWLVIILVYAGLIGASILSR